MKPNTNNSFLMNGRNTVDKFRVLWRRGVKVIFRGQRSGVLTGEHRYTDTVVIQFPDQDALRVWYASEAYQALITLRNEAAEMVLVSYDG